MVRAYPLLLFCATACIVSAGRFKKQAKPPPPPPSALDELKTDLTAVVLAVRDKAVANAAAALNLAKGTAFSAAAVANIVARSCTHPRASLSAVAASARTLHDDAAHWLESFPVSTETVLDDWAHDAIASVSARLCVSCPLVAALACGALAAVGALAAKFYPALAAAAKRAATPLRAATALFLLVYGEHVYLIVQAGSAFGAVGWPVVVEGAGAIAAMVGEAHEEIAAELGKARAAARVFLSALASREPAKLRKAGSGLGAACAGLPLALAASVRPEEVVAIGTGVLTGVLSTLATVTSDAAATLTVALALARNLGARGIAVAAKPLERAAACADAAKPGSGEAVGAYAKQAIKAGALSAALAVLADNPALVRRLPPALLGSNLALGLVRNDSGALEYGLAAVACYVQAKAAGASLPAPLAASLHWVLRGEAYLYSLSQQTAGA